MACPVEALEKVGKRPRRPQKTQKRPETLEEWEEVQKPRKSQKTLGRGPSPQKVQKRPRRSPQKRPRGPEKAGKGPFQGQKRPRPRKGWENVQKPRKSRGPEKAGFGTSKGVWGTCQPQVCPSPPFSLRAAPCTKPVLDKAKNKTFGQNSGTQTLYNFYKPCSLRNSEPRCGFLQGWDLYWGALGANMRPTWFSRGYGGFPKLGVPFGCPNNKDYSILGLYWGPLMLGNYHI